MRGEFLDVRYINPFITAIQSVFETMVHTSVSIGKPVLLDDHNSTAEVSGIIGLSGDVVGSVVLSFSFDVAGKVASAFAGAEIDAEHPDFADAIGELANMIAGSAKAQFKNSKVSVSLPSVITGKEHTVSQSRTSPRLLIPFETSLGPVALDVGIRNEKIAARPAPVVAGASQ
jgi:chemotaxis protein CheX